MRKQVAVIGLGRFGSGLAETLSNIGYDVLAIDTDLEKVQDIANKVTQAVQGDATDEAFLKGLDVGSLDAAVVAIGTALQSSVLCALLLKNLGVRYLIARAENDAHGSILAKIGADQVVYPERQMGGRLAHVLTLRGALDYIPVLQRYGVAKIAAPTTVVGKTLAQAGFGRKADWGVIVLLILRHEEAIVTPSDTEVIKTGDVLVTAGQDDKLEGLLNDAKNNTP
jgi:trk system potassium uptake protein TrkA